MIRLLPKNPAETDEVSTGYSFISDTTKWSVGPSKPIKHRTLVLYAELAKDGGFYGGGESLRTTYDNK